MNLVAMKPIIKIIWMHFVFDFFFQSDDMAQKKSISNKWLSYHIAVYTLPFFLIGWKFALVNGAAHWCTDWCTSRVNSRLYKANRIHAFFVGVGFDQAIHTTTLLLTWKYMVGH